MFGAKGVISAPAWGSTSGSSESRGRPSAESAIQPYATGCAIRGRRSLKMGRRELSGNLRYSCIDLTPEVNRAFRVGGFEFF